jgi:sulfonate transport system substrate-binding protein
MHINRLVSSALIAVMACAVIAVCAGCGSSAKATADTSASSAKAPDLKDVTITFGDIGDNLQDILRFAGEENTPYTLKWANFPAAPPITAAMVAGDVDAADMSLTALSVGLAAGAPLKAIGNLPESANTFRIIAKQSSGIQGPADLKGKRVGVLEGNAGEGLLIAALKSVGLTLKDVTLVNVEPNTGLQAFKSGQIDAWAIWDPWATEAAIGDPVHVVANDSGIWSNDGDFVATSSALHDPGKRAALADLMTRYIRAAAKIRTDPAGWAAFYAKATGLPLALAKVTLADNTYQLEPISTNPSNLKTVADTMAGAGLLKPIPASVLGSVSDPALNSQITAADQAVGQ